MNYKKILFVSTFVFAVFLSGCLVGNENEHEEELTYSNISASEFQGMLVDKDFFLLDVHIPEQDHIEGTDAVIPYDEIDANLDKLPDDKSETIVVYCRSGSMSLSVSKELVDLGYEDVINLQGGRNAYVELTETQ